MAPLPDPRAMGNLYLGADGVVYQEFGGTWTPLTDRRGRPLPVAEMRRLASPRQPLPSGLRLTAKGDEQWPPHEFRFSLANQAGRVVRAWRVTSKDELGGMGGKPALVGGDLVVTLGVGKWRAKDDCLHEYVVLRLGPAAGTRVRFALDARAAWGDTVTALRVGPDGKLYQLRSNPATGVSIARYSLAPTPATTTPSGGGAAPGSTVAPPPATSPPAPAPTVTTPPATPPAVRAEPAGRSIVPWLGALGASTLFAVGTWLLYRHRHGVGGRHPPRPAH
jgi:hypothetical protein